MSERWDLPRAFETDERAAFRETVRSFVEREIRPHVDAWDEAGEFPGELHEKAGELGLFGFGIDERYGGLGMDDAFLRAIMAEEVGRGGAGGVLAGLGARGISLAPIQLLGSRALKERVLPEVVSGRKCSALAITEPSGGSDVAAMKTRARQDGDAYIIDGSKTFITSGMIADFFVLGARTGEAPYDISLFLVDHDAPGFSRTPLERKMGWWCSDQATLYFEACRVPSENRLGPENAGFAAIMGNFNLERIAIVAQSLGMMKACLEDSVTWARERTTFGKRLADHQVIRHKIAEMSARTNAVQSYLDSVCWQTNRAMASMKLPYGEIAKLKFFATQELAWVVNEAMQILGGAGYLRGNRVERAYREVKVMAIGGGSEEIMRELAARQMKL